MMNCFWETAPPARVVHHCDWLSRPVSEGDNRTTCEKTSAHVRNMLSNWRLYHLLIALQAACLTFASRHGMGTSLRCACYHSDQKTLSRLQVALWDSSRDEDRTYTCQRAALRA